MVTDQPVSPVSRWSICRYKLGCLRHDKCKLQVEMSKIFSCHVESQAKPRLCPLHTKPFLFLQCKQTKAHLSYLLWISQGSLISTSGTIQSDASFVCIWTYRTQRLSSLCRPVSLRKKSNRYQRGDACKMYIHFLLFSLTDVPLVSFSHYHFFILKKKSETKTESVYICFPLYCMKMW